MILKYDRTRVEKIEDFMEDWSKFKDNQYDDDGKLRLGMREMDQRRSGRNTRKFFTGTKIASLNSVASITISFSLILSSFLIISTPFFFYEV